jgi:hypothetical protein
LAVRKPRVTKGAGSYEKSIFINCPFDDEYYELFQVIIFTIIECGFVPRCAEEEENPIRIEKILRMIEQCKFGIHDLSRTELDDENKLPRFNMAFELGVFLGAQRFGNSQQKQKCFKIFDIDKHRIAKCLSDLSGHDSVAHTNNPVKLIEHLRNWINNYPYIKPLPEWLEIKNSYDIFCSALPKLRRNAQSRITFKDLVFLISEWERPLSRYKATD